MTDPAKERILAASTQTESPQKARSLAAAANVPLPATRTILQELVAEGDILMFESNNEPLYAPDPVRSYFEKINSLTRGDVPVGYITSVRRELNDWWDAGEISSPKELSAFSRGARLVATANYPTGVQVYEADWDVLVILDTCRVDALRSIADQVDNIDRADVEERVSLGSQTAEWLCHTFTEERRKSINGTGYISGNGWVKAVFEDGLRPDDDVWFKGLEPPTNWSVVDGSAFGVLVHAWRKGKGKYSKEIPWEPHPEPRTVTDHAISVARNIENIDRIVVHYKQPHAPYTVTAREEGREKLLESEKAPFDFLAEGGSWGQVWDAYITDLRAAVSELNVLRRNIDGKIAVTADHGEAFGECGDYGHRPTMVHPMVRRVPWMTVTGSDEETRSVNQSVYDELEMDVERHLESLGYR